MNGSSGRITSDQLNSDEQNGKKVGQSTAQYGRAKVDLVKEIIRLTNLEAGDVRNVLLIG